MSSDTKDVLAVGAERIGVEMQGEIETEDANSEGEWVLTADFFRDFITADPGVAALVEFVTMHTQGQIDHNLRKMALAALKKWTHGE